MSRVSRRLEELGLTLPAPMQLPPGISVPFRWARVHGNRVYISGHGPVDQDGATRGPFGKVPSEVSLEAAQEAAHRTGLAMLRSIESEIGDLDRVTAWLIVNGMVNADPGYANTTAVINPLSDLLLALFGDEIGAHARTAIGVAALPLNLAVIVSAEVEIA